MRKILAVGVLALGAALAPLAAQAQSFEVGPRGFRVDPNDDGGRGRYREEYRERRSDTIDQREAVQIARTAGVDRATRVSGGYGRDWYIIGVDRYGRQVRVTVDDRNGRILSRDRD